VQHPVTAAELEAAAFQTAITFCIAVVYAFLYRHYRKPYLGWFTLAWGVYLVRLGIITTFLATGVWGWLFWHQVATGWTALALLWAALVFSRRLAWRWRYLGYALFPVAWSYVAIYRLDNFLLAAMPAVLFLSLVTLVTGWVFLGYFRQVRSGGAAMLAGALLLWGVHHLDYPFLRARGAWVPWGYYLDILFMLATGAGMVLLVLDDVRRGLGALLTLSGDIQRGAPGEDGLGRLLERPLALPAVRGSALYGLVGGNVTLLRGSGVCTGWTGAAPAAAEAAEITRAILHGEPRFTGRWRAPDGAGPGRTFAFAAVLPVFQHAGSTAALLVVGDARDPFAALDEGFLVALGQQIGAALEHAGRTAELERLQRRMVQQNEQERRRLSLHLHDETAQLFTSVKLQLGVLKEQSDPGLADRLSHLLDLMDQGIASIRNLTNDLRPSLLDDLGLLPALRSLAAESARSYQLTVEVEAPAALPALSPEGELALYRALQESLTNVAEHAYASRVAVRVAVEGGAVLLEVRDDGRGFAQGGAVEGLERAGHLGLAGMRERITALGGSLATGNVPEGGARVIVRVPVGEAGL
jgi:signal transduction histidine kinase